MDSIELAATQAAVAGKPVTAGVRFLDAARKPLAAVLPFHLALVRPDGRAQYELYRSTDRSGRFAISLPLGANAPPGAWSLVVRSQLTGDTATLPITVAADGRPPATAGVLRDRVVVRQVEAIRQVLARGSRPVLPIFDSPAAERLLPVAERVRAVLAAQGISVEIRRNPELVTYRLAYDLTDAQKQENARAERGEAIGRIRRETVNGNDWYSAMSGYRFGRPVILLNLAGDRGDNPMAEALDGGEHRDRGGLLWPQVSEAFPGPGRAVVQGIHWAFAPRVPALVIQAMDVDGLLAGAESLAALPQDRLTPPIEAAKAGLWRQFHVGGRPEQPSAQGLTSAGLLRGRAPQPFAIRFVGATPPPAGQAAPPAPPERPALAVPAVFEPKQFTTMMRDGDRFIEFLVPDLRFSQAIRLSADVRQAGKLKITASGVFRYNDRKPCWQAQWEDIIELREKLLPKQRLPMEIEVRVGDRTVGRLVPVKTETREVPLELASHSAGLKPRTSVEEVVLELSAQIDLPAGRQQLLLIHHNMVDGRLQAVGVGVEPKGK
jgi:hypothetical protein